jgi:serine/threonine-protein kinase
VTVTDFGVAEGRVFLVMEYLEGYDLRAKLRQCRIISLPETVEILAQVCAALDKAHRRGLIHRDLKPDNILLVRDEESGTEQVKVLDFGIAKLKTPTTSLAALTERGMMVGTPCYMSPEQCQGEELDARSDIYALAGC